MSHRYRQIQVDGDVFYFYPSDLSLRKKLRQCDSGTSCEPLNRADSSAAAGDGFKRLSIDITDRCNMACTYCYERAKGEINAMEQADMKLGLFAEVVNSMIGTSNDFHVHFMGGEPFLNFGLLRDGVLYCLQLAEKRGTRCTFSATTNGTAIDVGIAGFVKRYNIRLKITFDGLATIQNRNRPMADGGGSYDRVVSSLKMLDERGCEYKINSVVTALAIPVIPQAYNAMCDFNPMKVRFNSLMADTKSACRYKEDDIICYGSALRTIIDDLINSGKEKEVMKLDNIASYLPYIHQRKKKTNYCPALAGSSCSIGIDGYVYPCSTFSGNSNFCLGRYDAVNMVSPSYRSETGLSKRCSECWAYELCGGGCMHDFFVGNRGCADTRSACQQCEFIKQDINVALELYCRLYPHKIQ